MQSAKHVVLPESGLLRASRWSGFRKITQKMLATEVASENYSGMPDDLKSHLGLLSTFKAAAAYLGMGPRVINAIDWLFHFTQPQDWTSSSRPIVWPSSALQADELGIKTSQVKNLNRQLVSLGLVVMRDSPNGKRYGYRDKQGKILSAYGFDLSPLAVRYEEFRQIAAEARAERQTVRDLKRRATMARNSIKQTLSAMEELGGGECDADESSALMNEAWTSPRSPVELAKKVDHLELIALRVRERLILLNKKANESVASSVESGPTEPANWPHKYSYYSKNLSKKDTVTAMGKEKVTEGKNEQQCDADKKRDDTQKVASAPSVKITPNELIRIAPRLRTYLTSTKPSWTEIIDAADWLRHELDIDKPLWGSACSILGRELAAITVAIISTRPRNYFKKGISNYFYGMIKKAIAGELNLSQSIWGIRKNISLIN